MDDDPYAFCYGIEKDAVKVFDKAGLAAFEKRISARFETAATAKPTPGKPLGDQPEHLRRRGADFCAHSTSRRGTSPPTSRSPARGLAPARLTYGSGSAELTTLPVFGEKRLDIGLDVVFVHQSRHVSPCHPPPLVYQECVGHVLDSVSRRYCLVPK
jgi:hypothetical protein